MQPSGTACHHQGAGYLCLVVGKVPHVYLLRFQQGVYQLILVLVVLVEAAPLPLGDLREP